MIKLIKTNGALLLLLVCSAAAKAQDGLDIDVDLDGNDTPGIFSNPLFWVGVAVFIIILALIFRTSGAKK